MKTILTQNTLILFALVIIAAFSFTACNDMVSPNDAEINNGLFSEEYEGEAEARRRAIAAADAAAEEENEEVLSCSFGTKELRFGGAQAKAGTIDIQIVNDNKLVIDFKADAGWEFSETVVGINIVRPNGTTQPFGQWNPGNELYDPKVTSVTREVVLTGEPHNITPGDTFSVGAKAQAHQSDSNGGGETSTAGDKEMSQGQANYFELTWECPPAPTSGSFDGAN